MQKADATPAQSTLEPGRLAYPLNDFADAIGVGRSKVYAEIKAGRLKAKKIGSRTIITSDAAHTYLDALPDKAA
jgi:hypothetical protein